MAEIRFDGVSCHYKGSTKAAVSELDLAVGDGEFLVLVGPSGCGKTTSLRLLAGLEQVSAGRILMAEQDVSGLSPSKRDIAMVFQSYALYPNMTVAQNIEFPLKVAGVGKRDRRDQAQRVAAMLELSDVSCSAGQRRYRGANVSGSRWAAPSYDGHAHSCSTSRCPILMPSCEWRRERRLPRFSVSSASRPCM